MQDNTVTIDRTQSPTALHFAPVFNAAVPFIDRHTSGERADKIAIISESGKISFRELARGVNRCGNLLSSLGIGRGDRLLLIVRDCPEFFYCFWGAIKAGIIPVPVNTLFRARDYQYIIEDSGCAAIIYSPEFAGEVEPALTRGAREPGVIMRAEGDSDSLAMRMKRASDELEPVPAGANDDCFWLYSSGSTGRPKAAVHSHRNMVVTSQYYGVETLGIREEDLCFSAPKLFFAYGLGNAMTFPLWVGASSVLFPGKPKPESIFEIIEKHRPTLFFGVPTLYAAQLRLMEKTKPDLSSIRLCVSAGEALPADIFRRWKEITGLLILDGIGSTEALHIFISNRENVVKPGTSGLPVTGYEVKIVDENNQKVEKGETGRLWIKGDSCTKYYWNAPDKTAGTILDNWLNTGDTYYEDEEGFYVYCGRSDDMLKVGGLWCSPFEIEARLIEHKSVLEAAVVGREDGDGLTKPEACVVLKNPDEATDALACELLAHCKSGLAPYKYPRWINFIDELPKTATGKIQRFRLRRKVDHGGCG